MAKRLSKNLKNARESFDRTIAYELEEAIELAKKLHMQNLMHQLI
ncbi:hypothetical protein [Mycoplasmopsis cynos]